MTQPIRSITGDGAEGVAALPRVARVKDIEAPHRHKFCNLEYALTEFDRIAKCAYFDHQRDKVLFRTSPVMKQANRRQRRRPALKVNRVIECKRPACCPRCTSDAFAVRG